MTREEAAAKAITARYGDPIRRWKQDVDDATVALAAADAHDAANGVHRVVIDDTTVERVARALNSQFTLQWEKLPEWVREDERRMVRAVLEAAVQEGQ